MLYRPVSNESCSWRKLCDNLEVETDIVMRKLHSYNKESMTKKPFAERTSIEQVEEGVELAPKFDARGLMPCVTTDAPLVTC